MTDQNTMHVFRCSQVPFVYNMVVIVSGGAGFIGSHTCVELVAEGYDVVVVDSLVNSSEQAISRVTEITGQSDKVTFFRVDLCDMQALDNVFAQCSKIDAVIHFAALKAVGDSVSRPLDYFENNLGGTFNLLRCMDKYECRRLVFSSSATVYGSAPIPYTETSPVGTGITNPYGRTKFMIEEILRDVHAAPSGKDWSLVLLRYFNPVGAHPSGKIGEDPEGVPNNLMPYISQVAVGGSCARVCSSKDKQFDITCVLRSATIRVLKSFKFGPHVLGGHP